MAPWTPAQCASRKVASFTPAERRWLLAGVCDALADQTEPEERIGNWAFAALTVLLLLAIGAGVLT